MTTADSTGSADPYTTIEVAGLLGMAVRSVQLMVDRGELEAWKTPGGHRRISRASVERWLAARQSGIRRRRRDRRARAARRTAPRAARAADRGLGALPEPRSPAARRRSSRRSSCTSPTKASPGWRWPAQLQPDVLLVDILLPGIDGATLITSLRSHPQFSQQPADRHHLAGRGAARALRLRAGRRAGGAQAAAGDRTAGPAGRGAGHARPARPRPRHDPAARAAGRRRRVDPPLRRAGPGRTATSSWSRCAGVAPAREALRQGPFELIITDLMMPGETGLDLLQHLADHPAQRGAARVAVFSAGLTAAMQQRLDTFDVWRQLSKPISLTALEDCVRDAVGAASAPSLATSAAPRRRRRRQPERRRAGRHRTPLRRRQAPLHRLPRQLPGAVRRRPARRRRRRGRRRRARTAPPGAQPEERARHARPRRAGATARALEDAAAAADWAAASRLWQQLRAHLGARALNRHGKRRRSDKAHARFALNLIQVSFSELSSLHRFGGPPGLPLLERP